MVNTLHSNRSVNMGWHGVGELALQRDSTLPSDFWET